MYVSKLDSLIGKHKLESGFFFLFFSRSSFVDLAVTSCEVPENRESPKKQHSDLNTTSTTVTATAITEAIDSEAH